MARMLIAFALVLALLFGCAQQPAPDSAAQPQQNLPEPTQPAAPSAEPAFTPLSDFPSDSSAYGNASDGEPSVMPDFGDSVLGAADDANFTLHVVYFYGATCQYSAKSTPTVEQLMDEYAGKNVKFHIYEVWLDAENRKLYDRIADAYRIPPGNRGVPLLFIDGEYLSGYEKINQYLKQEIDVCLRIRCPNPLEAPLRPEITRPL